MWVMPNVSSEASIEVLTLLDEVNHLFFTSIIKFLKQL